MKFDKEEDRTFLGLKLRNTHDLISDNTIQSDLIRKVACRKNKILKYPTTRNSRTLHIPRFGCFRSMKQLSA